MPVEEKHIVDRMALFIGLFYGKYFLESSLIPCAPANDLQFYISMVKLKAIDEDIASSVIKSIKRHLDYLTEENVIFSLFDENLSPEDRSNIAKILFVTPRPEVFSLGKPKLPQIDFNKDDEPHLSLFVGSKSWLLFNKLGLFEKQEWLNLPCDYWHNFTDFRTAKDFVLQINTTNDSAERGVKLITDFKNHCCDEVEREYLSQVKSIKKCHELLKEKHYFHVYDLYGSTDPCPEFNDQRPGKRAVAAGVLGVRARVRGAAICGLTSKSCASLNFYFFLMIFSPNV